MTERAPTRAGGSGGASLLVLEDDRELAKLLDEQLSLAGYRVRVAHDLATARDLVAMESFDLLVLDRNLPDGDGLSLAEEVSSDQGNGTSVRPAVLMLTAMADVESRVTALYAGAGDYLVKPFSTQELLARVHVRLRERGSGEALTYGDLLRDERNHALRLGGEVELLPETEFTVLAMLLRYRGRVLSQEDLERAIYGPDLPDSNTVEVFVYNLRRKLKRFGLDGVIRTVRGRGYIVL